MIKEYIGRLITEIIAINHLVQCGTEKIHVVKLIARDIFEIHIIIPILETLRIIITLLSFSSNTNRDKDSKAMIERSCQENQVPLVYFFTVVCILILTQGIDRLHRLTVKFLKIKASILFGRIKKVKYQSKEIIILHLVIIIIHMPNSSMTRMMIIETNRSNLISNKNRNSNNLHHLT